MCTVPDAEAVVSRPAPRELAVGVDVGELDFGEEFDCFVTVAAVGVCSCTALPSAMLSIAEPNASHELAPSVKHSAAEADAVADSGADADAGSAVVSVADAAAAAAGVDGSEIGGELQSADCTTVRGGVDTDGTTSGCVVAGTESSDDDSETSTVD